MVHAPGQVAEEVFTLSRVVRTFGTEARESERYLGWLRRLTRVSVRQAAAYFMYLTTNSGLWYLAKVQRPPCKHMVLARRCVLCYLGRLSLLAMHTRRTHLLCDPVWARHA